MPRSMNMRSAEVAAYSLSIHAVSRPVQHREKAAGTSVSLSTIALLSWLTFRWRDHGGRAENDNRSRPPASVDRRCVVTDSSNAGPGFRRSTTGYSFRFPGRDVIEAPEQNGRRMIVDGPLQRHCARATPAPACRCSTSRSAPGSAVWPGARLAHGRGRVRSHLLRICLDTMSSPRHLFEFGRNDFHRPLELAGLFGKRARDAPCSPS
jgi:hypothetical protein